MDWPCHSSRSFHCKNCFTLDTRRETQEGLPQDHVAMDSGERNQGAGEDLGRHQAYGKGLADVEGACCYPTCHLSVKGMSEWVSKWNDWTDRSYASCPLSWTCHLSTLPVHYSTCWWWWMPGRTWPINCIANGPSLPFCLHCLMAGIVLAETVRRSIWPVDFYTSPTDVISQRGRGDHPYHDVSPLVGVSPLAMTSKPHLSLCPFFSVNPLFSRL